MAIGDKAASAGLDLVAGTDDRRDGWLEINKTRDYVADLKDAVDAKADAAHTHPELATASALSSGLAGKANTYGGNANAVRMAEGPTAAAYGRSATGSQYYSVWMNSDLQFMRNTSSRRYKESISAAALDLDKILALEPRTYHRKGQPDGTRELGLIAEEVAALDLPHLVSWDEYKPGQWRPEAVRYETVLPVMLLFAIKEQHKQINELRERLAALESKE